jgi:type IV pilus assembly protein PilA
MAHALILSPARRQFLKITAGIAAIVFFTSVCLAQTPPRTTQSPAPQWSQDPSKYPVADLGQLSEKLQHLQFPPPRTESHLLALLPQSTISYTAFSNYGDAIEQALAIFHQQLQDSPALRDWWQHGPASVFGPKIEHSLERLSSIDSFLGDEIVLAGTMDDPQHPKLLMIAEIKKPGLKPVLQQWLNELADKSKPSSTVRVLDPRDLESASNHPAEDLIVLVRPDFVIAASDLAALRDFNSHLAKDNLPFVNAPFARRIAKEYAKGITVLAAADLEKILKQVPVGTQQSQASFKQSGFGDMKYLIWDHTTVENKLVSQSEVSFTAPRHGFASWLASPAPLGGLDFVSPNSVIATSIVLAQPAKMFDDAQKFFSSSASNPFAAVTQMEKLLKISLKDDLLSHLTGELAVELDSLNANPPAWKAILEVNDSAQIQRTLSTLLSLAQLQITHSDDSGSTYYTVRVPSGTSFTDIHYAFSDGYLVAAPTHDAVSAALALHTSGESLAKSKKFLAALPPGHSLDSSMLFYENPVAIAALQSRQLAPGLSDIFTKNSKDSPPVVVGVYANDTAIRTSSSGQAWDFGVVAVVAAVAIPNLLRSRVAANEASAVGSLRTINTAQVAYAATYPRRGFASDLATLGPDPQKSDTPTPQHAGLISEPLAQPSCTADAWCMKSGYQFRVSAICKLHLCKEFVAVATPVDTNAGTRSFCSTSDGVIHSKTDPPPLTAAITVSQCRAWQPLQ